MPEHQVTVRYWAGARAAAGRDSDTLEALDLAPAPTVGAALDRVRSMHPDLVPVLRVASILVDGVAARPEDALRDGVRLEVLPPFAGG